MHAIRHSKVKRVCYIVLRACVVLHLKTRGQTKLDVRKMNKRDTGIWGEWVVGAQSKVWGSEGLG